MHATQILYQAAGSDCKEMQNRPTEPLPLRVHLTIEDGSAAAIHSA